MATVTPQITDVNGSILWSWFPINGGDTCVPIVSPEYQDKTVVVVNPPGAGQGNWLFTLMGSNDFTAPTSMQNTAVLTDVSTGNAINNTNSATASTAGALVGFFVVKENTLKIAPNVQVGTSINVTIMCAKKR